MRTMAGTRKAGNGNRKDSTAKKTTRTAKTTKTAKKAPVRTANTKGTAAKKTVGKTAPRKTVGKTAPKTASYGRKAYIVKAEQGPVPYPMGPSVFEYVGGETSNPDSYVDPMGRSLRMMVGRYRKELKASVAKKKFRSKDDMIRWIGGKGFTVQPLIDGGVYMYPNDGSDYGDPGWVHDRAEDYRGWKEGEVYNVAFEDDPSVEGYYGPIRIDDPRDLPKGAQIVMSDYPEGPRPYYGDRAGDFVEQQFRTVTPRKDRRYTFKGEIRNLTYEQAVALGMDEDTEPLFHDTKLIARYDDEVQRSWGDITRTNNRKPSGRR